MSQFLSPSNPPVLSQHRQRACTLSSPLSGDGGVGSYRLGAQSCKTAPTSDTSRKSRMSPVLCWAGYKSEIPSGHFITRWSHSQSSGKHVLTLHLAIYYKGCDRGHRWVTSCRGPQGGVRNGPWGVGVHCQPGSSSHLNSFTFLVELNLQPPPFLRGPQVGWRVSTLLLLGLSSDQPHHESPH